MTNMKLLVENHAQWLVCCQQLLTSWREIILKTYVLILALLLWAEKTREQNTCKSDLNRKMLERPNLCYIFEKLRVQWCQIWHSHVSIPFNSSPRCKKNSIFGNNRDPWSFDMVKCHGNIYSDNKWMKGVWYSCS